jgi:hypothetical protein
MARNRVGTEEPLASTFGSVIWQTAHGGGTTRYLDHVESEAA